MHIHTEPHVARIPPRIQVSCHDKKIVLHSTLAAHGMCGGFCAFSLSNTCKKEYQGHTYASTCTHIFYFGVACDCCRLLLCRLNNLRTFLCSSICLLSIPFLVLWQQKIYNRRFGIKMRTFMHIQHKRRKKLQKLRQRDGQISICAYCENWIKFCVCM